MRKLATMIGAAVLVAAMIGFSTAGAYANPEDVVILKCAQKLSYNRALNPVSGARPNNESAVMQISASSGFDIPDACLPEDRDTSCATCLAEICNTDTPGRLKVQ